MSKVRLSSSAMTEGTKFDHPGHRHCRPQLQAEFDLTRCWQPRQPGGPSLKTQLGIVLESANGTHIMDSLGKETGERGQPPEHD